jgi:hypothetical protein
MAVWAQARSRRTGGHAEAATTERSRRASETICPLEARSGFGARASMLRSPRGRLEAPTVVATLSSVKRDREQAFGDRRFDRPGLARAMIRPVNLALLRGGLSECSEIAHHRREVSSSSAVAQSGWPPWVSRSAHKITPRLPPGLVVTPALTGRSSGRKPGAQPAACPSLRTPKATVVRNAVSPAGSYASASGEVVQPLLALVERIWRDGGSRNVKWARRSASPREQLGDGRERGLWPSRREARVPSAPGLWLRPTWA